MVSKSKLLVIVMFRPDLLNLVLLLAGRVTFVGLRNLAIQVIGLVILVHALGRHLGHFVLVIVDVLDMLLLR